MAQNKTSSSGITITETVLVNSIYWISSVNAHERGSTFRVTEDLEDFSKLNQIDFQHFQIESASNFVAVMEEISKRASLGVLPLLHFDCHGCREKGLYMTGSDEFVPWETVADLLRTINVPTRNNLSCVFGVCYGLHLGFQLSLSRSAPFYLMIGPPAEVETGFIEDNIREFYRQVFQAGNITHAHTTILGPKLDVFHCQKIFATSMAQYFADHCSHKARLDRAKKMTENVVGRNNRRMEQKRIIGQLAPSQKHIDKFANLFLIGREPGVSLLELKKMAAKRKNKTRKTK